MNLEYWFDFSEIFACARVSATYSNWQGGVKKFKFSIRTSLRNRIHIRKICAQTSWHIPFKLPPEFVSLVRQVRGSCWSWRPVGPLSSAPYTSPSSYPLMRTFPPPAPTNIKPTAKTFVDFFVVEILQIHFFTCFYFTFNKNNRQK